MADSISNAEDIIDSRDVIARIEELEREQDALDAERTDAFDTEGEEAATLALDEWRDSYGEELAALQALAAEGEGYAADWHYGETLIRDTHFEDYAQQLAEDIGAIDPNASWPNSCIDWERAARELQSDYTSVDFDGVTYWVR